MSLSGEEGLEVSLVVAGIQFPVAAAFPVSRKRELLAGVQAAAPVIIHPLLAQPPPVSQAGAGGFSFLPCPAPPQSLSSAEIDEHPGNAGNPHRRSQHMPEAFPLSLGSFQP